MTGFVSTLCLCTSPEVAARRIEQVEGWRGKQISLFLETLQQQHFVLTKFVLLPCGLFSCHCEPLLNIVFLFHIQNKPRQKPEKTAHTRKEEKRMRGWSLEKVVEFPSC